jgi:hypothetical protein
MFVEDFTRKGHNARNDDRCESVIARPLRPWQSSALKYKAWIARVKHDMFVQHFTHKEHNARNDVP